MKKESRKSELKDLYSGEYIYVWRDDENVFFEVLPNGVVLTVPLEYWRKFKKELRKIVKVKDEAQDLLDNFKAYNSEENLFVPTFQSAKNPRKLIKILDSERYVEEDAKKVIEYFKHDQHEVLIVWDNELVDENKDQLRDKILRFCEYDDLVAQVLA